MENNADPSCKVKNTFLEFSVPGDRDGTSNKRRSWSDAGGNSRRTSPMVVASKSPPLSPQRGPDGEPREPREAMPIDEVEFELLESVEEDGGQTSSGLPRYQSAGLERDEPAYVVPTTPSPFLHSSLAPSGPVPSFEYLCLPPPYGTGVEVPSGGDGGFGGCVPSMDYESMRYFAEMYGQDCVPGMFMPYGWPENMADLAMANPNGYAPQQDTAEEPPAAGAEAAAEDLTPAAKSSGSRPAAADRGGQQPGAASSRPAKEDEPTAAGAKTAGNGGAREEKASRREAGKAKAEKASVAGKAQAQVPAPAPAPAEETRRKGAGKGEEVEPDSSNITTVMLRNIPNKYTQVMLIKQLNLDFEREYDFIYMPIDFKNECNVGYSFINFMTPDACRRFQDQYHGVDVRKCLPGLNSKKIVEVTPARVQGLSENVQRLRNSPVMSQLLQHPEWMPQIFNDRGEEQPFPSPEQPLQPVKRRGRNREPRGDA